MGEIAAGAESPPSAGLRGETVCSQLVPDVERLKCYDDAAAQRKSQPPRTWVFRNGSRLSWTSAPIGMVGTWWWPRQHFDFEDVVQKELIRR
jgi:hypothetical protein